MSIRNAAILAWIITRLSWLLFAVLLGATLAIIARAL